MLVNYLCLSVFAVFLLSPLWPPTYSTKTVTNYRP
jgi:hypothetical protein